MASKKTIKTYSKDDFYDKIISLVPVTQKEDRNFRKELARVFEFYEDLVKGLLAGGAIVDANLANDCKQICKKILAIVASTYKGMHGTAFIQMANLMKKCSELNVFPIIEIETGKKMFRIRTLDGKRKNFKTVEMFHIPLSKRGIVKSQRFSMPGYPCLYVGESLYISWEEMRRPKLEDFAVSVFRNEKTIQLMDLSVHKKEDFFEHVNIRKNILLFPLIIACSFIVKNDEDDFKPEYIVPQLFLEWLINQNNKKTSDPFTSKSIGVYYTSIFSKNEGIKQSKNCVAIPVLDPLNSDEHCKVLKSIFSLTSPQNIGIQLMLSEARRKRNETLFDYIEHHLKSQVFKIIDK